MTFKNHLVFFRYIYKLSRRFCILVRLKPSALYVIALEFSPSELDFYLELACARMAEKVVQFYRSAEPDC